jgi:hypothetical protein
MTDYRYSARLSIAVVGEVDTGIETHKNADMAGGSWVAVRTGPVLTYCEHPGDAVGRATAWNNALLKARQILPVESDQTPADRERVIAQVTAQPRDTWDVTGYAAAAACDGVAVLYVRTGAVTFRCHDELAAATIQEAWRDAAMVAHMLWRPRLTR